MRKSSVPGANERVRGVLSPSYRKPAFDIRFPETGAIGRRYSTRRGPLGAADRRIAMTRVLVPLLSVAVLIAAGSRAGAQEPKDIIAKAIKAHGGEEALTKYPAAVAKNKGTLDLPGVGKVEFTQDVSYMLPDKFREEVSLSVNGMNFSVLTLVSGDTISMELNGNKMDPPEATKTALKDVGHLLKVGRLVTLVKDQGYEFSAVGEVMVEGKPALGVRVSAKDRKDINLYFDKETGLLAKMEHRTTNAATGDEVNEERIVVGYQKTKQDLPIPKKVIVKHDGKTFLEAEVQEAEFLEKIDDGQFKK
jgi:hypothetical protein